MENSPNYQNFTEKILFILSKNGPLHHSGIMEKTQQNGLYQRTSSRSYYKAYKELLKRGFIQKQMIEKNIQDNNKNERITRPYWGYSITDLGQQFCAILSKKITATSNNNTKIPINLQDSASINMEFINLMRSLVETVKNQNQLSNSPPISSQNISRSDEHIPEISESIPPTDFTPDPKEKENSDQLIHYEQSSVDDPAVEIEPPKSQIEELLEKLEKKGEDKAEILETIFQIEDLNKNQYLMALKKYFFSPEIGELSLILNYQIITPHDIQNLFRSAGDTITKDTIPKLLQLLRTEQISRDLWMELGKFWIENPKRENIYPILKSLPYSVEDWFEFAQVYINSTNKEIPKFIIRLIMTKSLDDEQKVSLLEYIYEVDKRSELIEQIDISVEALIKIADITQNPSSKLLFLGLSIKKIIATPNFSWEDHLDFEGKFISKRQILRQYIDFCIEIEDWEKPLNLLPYLIKTEQLQYFEFIQFLRIYLNIKYFEKFYNLIDKFAASFIKDPNLEEMVKLGKPYHEVLLYQDLSKEFETLKILLIQALYSTETLEQVKKRKLPQKWAIFGNIAKFCEMDEADTTPMRPFLEILSSHFKYAITESPNLNEITFFLQNFENEEILIVFTPYFAQWLIGTDHKQEAKELLLRWRNNSQLKPFYSLVYERILELLKSIDKEKHNFYEIEANQLAEKKKIFREIINQKN